MHVPERRAQAPRSTSRAPLEPLEWLFSRGHNAPLTHSFTGHYLLTACLSPPPPQAPPGSAATWGPGSSAAPPMGALQRGTSGGSAGGGPGSGGSSGGYGGLPAGSTFGRSRTMSGAR